MKALKSYLLILANLILGLLIVVAFNKWHSSTWLIRSTTTLLVFVLLNLAYVYAFKLKRELREFWSPRKFLLLPAGILGGGVIASSPILFSLWTGDLVFSEIAFESDITVYSLTLTFAIVGWEELWFRGILLNYCQKQVSAVTISLAVGFLFMIMHFLNPELNLFMKGPALFFAGSLLTMLYFYYRTIWLPLGVHFGNNFVDSVLETRLDGDIFIGNEGYLQAIFLGILYLLFAMLMVNKNKRTKSGF